MHAPYLADAFLELRNGYVYLRLPQDQPIWVTAKAAKLAIELSRQKNILNVMVNVSEFAIQPPSTADLFELIIRIAALIENQLRVAIVDSTGWPDLNAFMENVAKYRTVDCTIYPSEVEAIAWLLPPK